ncbi:MAG: methyltransferase domain-containing protein [Gammaproteobacteria bacterium]|nr:methyltransferase domain-containing protein [Gammaproteobacteria bacterium]
MNVNKIIQEYPEDYCSMLEFTYGKGMMSEGGVEAIDNMFAGINLNQKKCLDIGFGLAGAAHHLAATYGTYVTGLEINPRMVMEANKTIPSPLKKLLHFVTSENFPNIPFSTNEFDIAYSKGVFVHLEEKQEAFNEMYRVLKPKGSFIIDDWLSPHDNAWSDGVKKLCEMEDLSLFSTSEKTYLATLKHAGFKNIQTKNVSQEYSQYNLKIVERLMDKKVATIFQKKFSEKLWHDSIECYQLIADAMKDNEIIVMNMRAEK